MTRRSSILTAAPVAALLVLSACGHSSHSGSTGAAATTALADASTTGTFNDADVSFAQNMIPHHEQAVEMADMALDPTVGASAEVRALATRIKDAQDPEIELMRGWLAAWGKPEMADMAGHDMSSMDGMMSAEDMDSLGQLTGAEFDAAWLTMMIEHHKGAIEMADAVKANGTNPDVASLADQIIAAQNAEIDEMTTLLNV